ncbi:MAG: hypothetical protein AUI08_07415 [Gemmatimonadetes bacterium 13_2_20CM_2_65_7]|nr:MAG: hypothetical protein AUI08_07415 [Gemmatimonadetes bacterium 13_2_20CM_2_65_7]OLC42238.1 MAG: hypothetical protein AUH75_04830 [Gemmatimonadetes bacterium 13_1_40CM_4_65_7]
MTDTDSRARIITYYAIWATICAAVAGFVVALLHTWFFSYHPGRSALIETLFSGSVAAVAIAAGQGAVALVTGSLLVQLGRSLQYTVLLGLLIGLFDFAMYFIQMAVPPTELGWTPDVIILAAATIAITAAGSRKSAGAGAGAGAGTTMSGA